MQHTKNSTHGNIRKDRPEWIMAKTRQILQETGPKAARRFLESRGGVAKWEEASRMVARVAIANLKTKEVV